MFRIEQFVLVLFVVGLLSTTPFGLVRGQEAQSEMVSEPVQSEVTTTEVLEDVPQDVQEDSVVDGNQEVVDENSSTTPNTLLDTPPTTDAITEPTALVESTPELVETQPFSIPLETISQAVASSSSNVNLPFTLISSKMNFAINEVPTFSFSCTPKKTEGVVEGFIESVISTVTDTVSDIYEGSFVETIVDAVVDTVDTVIDSIIPTAEGQEVTPYVVQEVVQDDEPTDTLIINSNNETGLATSSMETVVATSTEAAVSPVKDEVSTTSIATTTPMKAFAIIDTLRHPVLITYTEEGVFVVDLVDAVFGVGVHTLELHIPFEGELHVAYYTFSVDGTVISTRVLQEGLTVLVVADQLGVQTLWLQRLQENGVRSFQQIADETTMSQNPVLEFKDNTLFWTTPLSEALIGFDVVSNSSFSQTLNFRARDENKLELQNGAYDVVVTPEDIDVTFIPEKP